MTEENKTVFNEKIKLRANGLNTCGIVCFTTGIAGPFYAYYVGQTVKVLPLGSVLVWLIMAVLFHLFAMNELNDLKET